MSPERGREQALGGVESRTAQVQADHELAVVGIDADPAHVWVRVKEVSEVVLDEAASSNVTRGIRVFLHRRLNERRACV